MDMLPYYCFGGCKPDASILCLISQRPFWVHNMLNCNHHSIQRERKFLCWRRCISYTCFLPQSLNSMHGNLHSNLLCSCHLLEDQRSWMVPWEIPWRGRRGRRKRSTESKHGMKCYLPKTTKSTSFLSNRIIKCISQGQTKTQSTTRIMGSRRRRSQFSPLPNMKWSLYVCVMPRLPTAFCH